MFVKGAVGDGVEVEAVVEEAVVFVMAEGTVSFRVAPKSPLGNAETLISVESRTAAPRLRPLMVNEEKGTMSKSRERTISLRGFYTKMISPSPVACAI